MGFQLSPGPAASARLQVEPSTTDRADFSSLRGQEKEGRSHTRPSRRARSPAHFAGPSRREAPPEPPRRGVTCVHHRYEDRRRAGLSARKNF
ncbi:unnamed protein product [Dicrocoelium dendriticum]|nr:unnamed protein product [Dicrocoelium dendriticum]